MGGAGRPVIFKQRAGKCLRFLSARACSENFSAASDGGAQVPRKLAGLLVVVLSLSFSLFSAYSESSGQREENISNREGETPYQQRSVDTATDFKTVNGVQAHGGSLGGPGAVIVGAMLYVNSGYSFVGSAPGNVLLGFSVGGK
jgi:hypothetical protein